MISKIQIRKQLRNPVLLTRDSFRESVFKRDNHTCVFCSAPAVDAHHIIDRRCWPDGGYYLENGASVCEEHHLQCEMTVISVEQVREAAGIDYVCVPDFVYEDERYDKWLSMYLPSGMRSKGPFFHDPSVQKILKMGGVLDQFSDLQKYPRTMHAPWSEGVHDDDRVIQSMGAFVGRRVIVTEKMDGENTTLMRDICHARSVDSRHHSSRDWVKNFWGGIKHDIPEGWRVCGENLYAEHSIRYKLDTYFQGFNIWNEANMCLSWEETLLYFELLAIKPVKVLFDGIYDEEAIKGLYNSKKDWESCEGYVIRVADSFHLSHFKNSVAKFVRKGHVQTGKHWLYGRQIKPNDLV
jgi:hypothetical protein